MRASHACVARPADGPRTWEAFQCHLARATGGFGELIQGTPQAKPLSPQHLLSTAIGRPSLHHPLGYAFELEEPDQGSMRSNSISTRMSSSSSMRSISWAIFNPR